ncbi:hypothetical protein PspLS_10245 [Pyricularia sp. CBS 133598]|nr:hypothetical protein PspLS_10245 [Pyricularia sp. CBS 133598]
MSVCLYHVWKVNLVVSITPGAGTSDQGAEVPVVVSLLPRSSPRLGNTRGKLVELVARQCTWGSRIGRFKTFNRRLGHISLRGGIGAARQAINSRAI